MNRPRRKSDKRLHACFWFLLAIAPALFLGVVWYALSDAYPRPDPADYFSTTQDIWMTFRDSGFFSALDHAYLQRNWRQLLHPSLASFFLMLTGGRVLAGLALFGLSCLVSFVTYVYLSLRLTLPPLRAIVGTWLLSLVPWLFATLVGFGSEALFFPCGVAAAYHFFRSNGLEDRRQNLATGVWIGLAISARPVEGTLALVLPLLFWFSSAHWGKRGWWRPLVPVAGLGGVFSVYVVLNAFLGESWIQSWRIPLALVVLAAPAVYFLRRKSTGILEAACAAYLVIVFWFGPRTWALLHWIQVTTISEFAQATGGAGIEKFSDFLWNVFVAPGWWLALFAFATAAYVAKTTGIERRSRALFLALLLTWGLLFFLELTTSNRDARYFQGVWILALLGALSLALSSEGRRARERLVFFGVFAIVGFLHLGLRITPSAIRADSVRAVIMRASAGIFLTFRPVDLGSEPALAVIDELEKVLPRGRALKIAEINLHKEGFHDAPINPQTLMIIARERGLRWTINGVGFGSPGKTVTEVEAWLSNEYDALFVAPASGDAAPPSVFQSALHGQFAASLAEKTRRNESGGSFSFAGRFAYEAWGPKDEIFVYNAVKASGSK